MVAKLIGFLIGAGALFLTSKIDVYSIIGMMVLLEIVSVMRMIKVSNSAVLIGMLICQAYFLYEGIDLTGFQYFVYVSFYLFVRHKGNEWFVNNNVNEYLYLLFALSVPMFLDFITQMMEIKMSILLFVALYFTFLRMSDWIIHTKLTIVLFSLTQIISALSLDKFILQDDMKIYFVVGITIWTLIKLKGKGKNNVSRVFIRNLFRKSSQGVY